MHPKPTRQHILHVSLLTNMTAAVRLCTHGSHIQRLQHTQKPLSLPASWFLDAPPITSVIIAGARWLTAWPQ